MPIRQPMRVPLQPPPAPPRPQRRWDILLIGIAFGFGCGVLLTVGLVWLLSGNSSATGPSTGNSGAAATAIPTATYTPTPTHTATPTPLPTDTPTPRPTATPTPTTNISPLLGPDDPRFYLGLFVIFVIAVVIFLARTSPPAKK